MILYRMHIQHMEVYMNYIRENLPKSRVKFTFTAEGEEWQEAIRKAYDKTKHNYSVEGFRKGKVPQKVIESKYGVGVFFEDAMDILLPESYSYALDNEKDVIPVARPDVNLIAISDTEVKYAITFTTQPEIELGQYTDLSVEKNVKEVTDKDIEDKIQQAREKAGSWKNITDRAVLAGDTVELNYSGSVDGEKFEGGTAENQTLTIGSGAFIEGFEEQLIGMNIGEEKDITVTFPKEYGMDKLAGQEAVFNVKINAIKVKELPEVDDEFVKDVSEFNTVEEYREDIKKQLTAANEEQAENEFSNSIIDKVILNSKMEIPPEMVESQIDDMVEDFARRMQYQGMKIDDYLKYTGLKMEDIRAQYKDVALKNIKIRLVLDAIVKKENITATDEEVENKIRKMADEVKKDYEEYKKNISDEYLEYFNKMVISDKLIEFLKNNNKVKE